jgi:hypothetical protein
MMAFILYGPYQKGTRYLSVSRVEKLFLSMTPIRKYMAVDLSTMHTVVKVSHFTDSTCAPFI